MFLVNYQQPQIVESNILLKQTVGAARLCSPCLRRVPRGSPSVQPESWNRLRRHTVTGNSAVLSRKVLKCCSARIVVGTRTATCLPRLRHGTRPLRQPRSSRTPTSPQTSLSIGTGRSKSASTEAMALA
ncbi:MAG: hypothetical protein MZV70_33365 [Desulfobacterales bacterium]|nr:hypothetical protein [Desulfobacterales bacterium]